MPRKTPKGTITGSWNDVQLVCPCHETAILMTIQEGPTSLFYACPKYHLENREAHERACNNRLSLEDYTKMLEHLHGVIAEAAANDERIQLTNYIWKNTKGTVYKVLTHDGDKFVISAHNKRAMKS